MATKVRKLELLLGGMDDAQTEEQPAPADAEGAWGSKPCAGGGAVRAVPLGLRVDWCCVLTSDG